MDKRCVTCGKYPFCNDIEEPSKPTNCEKWLRRGYDVRINKTSEYETRESNS